MSGPEQLGFDFDSAPGGFDDAGPGAELPDATARRRVETELDTNVLVEAGAGSGKTTILVRRIVALIRDGVEMRHVAAVTFTRKAAGELRQRVQESLEAELAAAVEPESRARLDRALGEIDQAFMGTIHAFCARLLRERPLDVGIDPDFTETTAAEARGLAARFWALHLERLAAHGSPVLGDLQDVGIEPHELRWLYDELVDNLDVDFPAAPTPPPDPAAVSRVRSQLDAVLDDAAESLPAEEPEKEWDDFQRRLRRVAYVRRYRRWSDDRVFLDALAELASRASWKTTLNRWTEGGGARAAKRIRDEVNRLIADGGSARLLLRDWWAYRYAIALRFALDGARSLASHRRAAGTLDFQDLLALAADLLRRSPGARRDLGGRWRRILVDEFQDTDPLQAEILFLLTSDPGEAERADWTEALPRPGALFVVGDPKQSIYRFRRADIALYHRIKQRFTGFGEVLTLTSNFRSGQAVAAFVNRAFRPPDGLFAEGDAEAQATFAPMNPRGEKARVSEGVRHYVVEGRSNARVAALDADGLAAWIAARVASGERQPGDFLVLTRLKRFLDRYARALESHGLPVQVSGAGVGVEREIRELELVLHALVDPGDATRTLAVLLGLFFGVDHAELLAHRRAGRSLDLRRASDDEDDPVEAALRTLRSWWRLARVRPADVVIQRIATDVGLLPHAAAGDLGSIRAGALGYVLDAVRSGSLEGDTSLSGALSALETALGEDEAEAPLEPGRTDVVRLMNLHKAKGLEARVVVLAGPFRQREHEPDRHVERDADGRAVGWFNIQRIEGRSRRVLAQPPDWETKAQREREFQRAEEVRVLYVATTRAEDELVIARADGSGSPWHPLERFALEQGAPLEIEPVPAPPPERLTATPEEIRERVDGARAARERAGDLGHRFLAVTHFAKGADGERVPAEDAPLVWQPDAGPGGYAWGTAVHGVLEAAGRGLQGRALRGVGRSLLIELDRPLTDGEPVELDALMATADRVLASELWGRARAASPSLSEVPFALAWDEGPTPVYLEGVVDLAFREGDGWVLVDYKTDRGDDPSFEARRGDYREQLRTYGTAWTRITGEPVKELLLWFVRADVVETVTSRMADG